MSVCNHLIRDHDAIFNKLLPYLWLKDEHIPCTQLSVED